MTIFGYVRKDYPEETLSQVKTLVARNCDDLFIENSDLTSDKELYRLLERLEQGDTLIVTSVLTFGKSVNELQEVVGEIVLKEAKLVSIREDLDTTEGYSFYTTLTLVENIHKEIVSEKIKQKLTKVKQSGKQLGRPSIDQETIDMINYLRNSQKLNLRDIAKKCGVSLGTVYKYLN